MEFHYKNIYSVPNFLEMSPIYVYFCLFWEIILLMNTLKCTDKILEQCIEDQTFVWHGFKMRISIIKVWKKRDVIFRKTSIIHFFCKVYSALQKNSTLKMVNFKGWKIKQKVLKNLPFFYHFFITTSFKVTSIFLFLKKKQ